MKVWQVDRKGNNTLVKDFLDDLERLGVEHKLEIDCPDINEVTFTVRTRTSAHDLEHLRVAVVKHLLGSQNLLEGDK